ncbi:AhpD-like protein [Dipodascopsis tothii]|uniref:AhpD-like protein n=1 Tax=Dipodascopsis tothii TaxID=44089 RepID=UPI0034CEFA94
MVGRDVVVGLYTKFGRGQQPLAGSWYYLAAVAFSACNQPDMVPVVYEVATEHEAPATVVPRMREALLKSTPLAGLPRAINSMAALRDAAPADLRATAPERPAQTLEERAEAGERTWARTYGKVADRVYAHLDTASPDLALFAQRDVYGSLLSHTGVLSLRETSLVVITCLVGLPDVGPQLKGHLHGGLNNGASLEEIRAVRALALDVCAACGVAWRGPVPSL